MNCRPAGTGVPKERGRGGPQVRRVLIRGDHVERGGQGGPLRERPPAHGHLQGRLLSNEAEFAARRGGLLAVQEHLRALLAPGARFN